MRYSFGVPLSIRQSKIDDFKTLIKEKFLKGRSENLLCGTFTDLEIDTFYKTIKKYSVEGTKDVFVWGIGGRKDYYIFVGFGDGNKVIDEDGSFLLLMASNPTNDFFVILEDSAATILDPKNNISRYVDYTLRDVKKMLDHLKGKNSKIGNYHIPSDCFLEKKLYISEKKQSDLRIYVEVDDETGKPKLNADDNILDLMEKSKSIVANSVEMGLSRRILFTRFSRIFSKMPEEYYHLEKIKTSEADTIFANVNSKEMRFTTPQQEKKEDEEEATRQRKQYCETIERLAVDFSKVNKALYHLEEVETLDLKTLFAKVTPFRPVDADGFALCRKVEEDWSDKDNIVNPEFVYFSFTRESCFIGKHIALKAKNVNWDVNAIFEKYNVRNDTVLENIEALSMPLSEYIKGLPKPESDTSDAKENASDEGTERINFKRFVEHFFPDDIHYETVDMLDVKKLFDILKTYKSDCQGKIRIRKEGFVGGSSFLVIGFDDGKSIGDVIKITAQSLNWDVNAIFEKYSSDEVIVEADILSMSPVRYVTTLPWTNRPRDKRGVLI